MRQPGVNWLSSRRRFTIVLVHLSNFAKVLALEQHIIIDFVPVCES